MSFRLSIADVVLFFTVTFLLFCFTNFNAKATNTCKVNLSKYHTIKMYPLLS